MFSALLASFLVSCISFLGILILTKKIQDMHTMLTSFVAFAAGAMLGDVFWHMLPEFLKHYEFNDMAVWGILFGITFMLLVEAYFHCSHDSHKDCHEHDSKAYLAPLNNIGDGIHNFLDGLAIGASFLTSFEVGVAATIAIALHEIPQELADVSVMKYAGWSNKKILVVNFLTGLTSLLGVLAVYLLSTTHILSEQIIIPFAIGQFIYIALADLVPEIHEKAGVKKYILEVSMFVGGLLMMYGLRFLG